MSKIAIPCDQCGAILTRKRSQVERSEYNFCDIKCRSAWRSENWRGNKNPSYKKRMTLVCKQCGVTFERLAYQQFCSTECNCRYQADRNRTSITVLCAHCGKQLERNQWEVGKRSKTGRFFCNVKCHAQWQSENWSGEHHPRYCEANWIEVPCAYCNEVVRKPARLAKSKDRFFCDTICAHKWQSENWIGENNHNWKDESHITVPCAYCGELLIRHPYKIQQAERSFCGMECMHKWQSENWSGENSHLWRGGRSYEPYSPEFNDALKQQVRERDGYACCLCGIPENGNAHDIHHVDYDKKNSNPVNLVALCRSCHSKTNGNRTLWQTYFSDLMLGEESSGVITWKK